MIMDSHTTDSSTDNPLISSSSLTLEPLKGHLGTWILDKTRSNSMLPLLIAKQLPMILSSSLISAQSVTLSLSLSQTDLTIQTVYQIAEKNQIVDKIEINILGKETHISTFYGKKETYRIRWDPVTLVLEVESKRNNSPDEIIHDSYIVMDNGNTLSVCSIYHNSLSSTNNSSNQTPFSIKQYYQRPVDYNLEYNLKTE